MLKIKISGSVFLKVKINFEATNGTSLNCWSRCCFNMRLNCERDLIVRTSRGSLIHFWMLLFCNDRLLDLGELTVQFCCFFLLRHYHLEENSQCRLISIMKYHS